MGFGIKTKALKILSHIQDPKFLYGNLTRTSFPKHPVSKFRINLRLKKALRDIQTVGIKNSIGLLGSEVDPYAVAIYQQFIAVNANNIGNWSIAPWRHGTRQVEYEVIHKLINLYKGRTQHLEGYVTTGGSEGNLYSVWIGKAFVTQTYALHQVCLLKTSMTHYSIDKACVMYSLSFKDIPLNPTTWTMDPMSLENEIIAQMKHGVYGFIISLTFGYTETGTSDNIERITTVVKKLKRLYKKLVISIIIDAAFNGLIEPFIVDDYRPFFSEDVHVFSTDFSKFTAVPYPAGVALYRKHLRKIIEREVQFFPVPDNTLLGSRPGASVASIWGVIHQHGLSGYRTLVLRQMKVKQYFIQRILTVFPDAEIVSGKTGLTCGVIISKKQFAMLPKEMEYKYRVYAKEESIPFSNGKTRKILLCKFFFLSQITTKTVDDVITSITRSLT